MIKYITQMETGAKMKQISFREWYNSLGTLEKREFRDTFMEVSGIQFPTFYSKLQRNSFTILEKKAIKEIIGDLQYEITF